MAQARSRAPAQVQEGSCGCSKIGGELRPQQLLFFSSADGADFCGCRGRPRFGRPESLEETFSEGLLGQLDRATLSISRSSQSQEIRRLVHVHDLESLPHLTYQATDGLPSRSQNQDNVVDIEHQDDLTVVQVVDTSVCSG